MKTTEQLREFMSENAKESGELSDEQLSEAAGGGFDYATDKATKYDNKNRPIQWCDRVKGSLYHYECPKCGRWMYYGGWGVKCDNCDESWFSKSDYKKND